MLLKSEDEWLNNLERDREAPLLVGGLDDLMVVTRSIAALCARRSLHVRLFFSGEMQLTAVLREDDFDPDAPLPTVDEWSDTP